MRWIPQGLPDNVKFIISTLSGDVFDSLASRKIKPIVERVTGLDEAEIREFVSEYMTEISREFPNEEVERAFFYKAKHGNPLYIKVALEELRVFGRFEELAIRVKELPDNVPDLFDQVLERIETDFNAPLVRDCMSFIACGRYGMTAEELQTLLKAHAQYLNAETTPEKLPDMLWARLYRSFSAYLFKRSGIIDFFHHQLLEAVYKKYLHETANRNSTHKTIADYFEKRWMEPYDRAMDELPFQRTKAEDWMEVEQILTNLHFIEAKCIYQDINRLLDDFRMTLQSCPVVANDLFSSIKEILNTLYTTLLSEAYNIRVHPEIVLQQIHNNLLPIANQSSKTMLIINTVIEILQIRGKPWFRLLVSGKETSVPKALTLSVDADYSYIAMSPNNIDFAVTGRSFDAIPSDITIWRTDTYEVKTTVGSFNYSKNRPVCLDWLDDGKHLFIVLIDGTVNIWDVITNTEVAKWSKSPIKKAALSEDGLNAILLMDKPHCHVIACDPTSGDEWVVFENKDYNIDEVVISNDGNFAILGGSSQTMKCVVLRWNIVQGTLQELYTSNDMTNVSSLALDQHNTLVAFGDWGGSILVIDTSSVRICASFPGTALGHRKRLINPYSITKYIGHNAWIQCLAFSADSKRLFSGSGMPRGHGIPGDFSVWDLEKQDFLSSKKFPAGIESLSITSDTNRVFIGGQGRLSIVEIGTLNNYGTKLPFNDYILSVAFSPDGKARALAYKDGLSIIYEEHLNLPITIKAHAGSTSCVDWDKKSNTVATGGGDGICCIWDATTGEEIKKFTTPPWDQAAISRVCFSINGTLAYVTEKGLVIINMDGSKQLYENKVSDSLTAASFSEDGRVIALGDSSGKIQLLNLNNCEATFLKDGHTGPIKEIIFTSSGLLVTASQDMTSCTWDLSTGKILAKYTGHSYYLSEILCLFTDSKFPNMVISSESDSWCSLRRATSVNPVALLPMEVWIIGINRSSDKKTLLLIDSMGEEFRFSGKELFES